MKKNRINSRLYITLAIIAVILVVMHEMDFLPIAYIASHPRTDYLLNLVAIIVALGSVFIAHRLLSRRSVVQKILRYDEEKAIEVYERYARYRYLVQATGMLVNLWLYYATIALNAPMYGFFIAAVSYAFCKPSITEYEKMRHPSDPIPPRRDGLSL